MNFSVKLLTLNFKIMKYIITTLLFVLTFTCFSQSWCTEQFDPELDLMDNTNSPDFGKKYTMYFYHVMYSSYDDIAAFTPIYKASFTNYDSDKMMIARNFAKPFAEEANSHFTNQHPDVYYSPNAGSSANYCLSIEDLKAEYNKRQTNAKEKGDKVILVGDFGPTNANYQPRNADSEQSVSFQLVE